jgi:GNAT superfamily N-acetyltransferase
MNETGVFIRQAGMEDVQGIAHLSEELGYPVNQEQIEQRLRRIVDKADHAVFVAEIENGGVVGWIHAFAAPNLTSEPFVELGGMVVASSLRGQGIGTLLLSEMEKWAKDKGIDTVRIRSRTTREQAHAFYRKMGYRHVKTQETFSKNV